MRLPAARLFSSVVLVAPCLGAALLAAGIPGQTPRDAGAAATQPARRGLISGTLVALDTGRPVRQARVTLSGGDPRVSKFVVTDDSGRFSFEDLPAGAFGLTASKSGFLDVIYGQKRPGSGRPGTVITLAAGQRLERMSLPITRGGVITGTVYDEAGEGMYGATVQAMRYVMRNGVRSLQVVRTGTTDDRGIYRLPILTPGEYTVVSTPRDTNAMQLETMKMRAELVAAEARAYVADQVAVELRGLRERLGAMEAAPPTTGYAPTFHPSSLLASGSTSVTVEGTEEKAGVDIRVQPVPLSSINGVVTAESPLPSGIQAILFDTAETAVSFGTRTARVGPNGQFSFTGVPPGTYTVLARGAGPVLHTVLTSTAGEPVEIHGSGQYVSFAKETRAESGDTLWAMTTVSVSGGTVPVSLHLQPGMTVSGSVTFTGNGGGPIDFTKLRLTAVPVEDPTFKAEGVFVRDVAVTADGQFTIRGVIPGRYRIVPATGVPPGFLIESAAFGGRDVLDFPLEVKPGENVAGGVVTFSTQQTELVGSLTDPAGAPAPGYTLILFAADGGYWTPGSRRIQTARPSSDGRYAFRSMPAGDYRLVAVEDVEPGLWFDPAFLKQLQNASMPVSLAPGEKRTQDIRAGR